MKLADKLRNRPVSISTYLMVLSALMLGILGILTSFVPEGRDSPFVKQLLIDVLPWSILLTAGNVLILIGLKRRVRWLLSIGSMASFSMWLFATVSFTALGGVDSVLVVCIPHVIFCAYIYIISMGGRTSD